MISISPSRQITVGDLVGDLLTKSQALEEANEELVLASEKWAYAERDYRRAYSVSYMQAEGAVETRKVSAHVRSLKEELARNLAEGFKVAALENVRSRRAQLSATQSVANAIKAELELGKTGP
jgi:hypothetical protein